MLLTLKAPHVLFTTKSHTSTHVCLLVQQRPEDVTFHPSASEERRGGEKKTVCCHGNNKLLLGEKCGGAAMLPAGWGGGLSKDRVNCLDINIRTHTHTLSQMFVASLISMNKLPAGLLHYLQR